VTPEILTAAGIAHHRRGRFVRPPGGSYAVWSDDITTDGPDGMPPAIFYHDVTVELYEPRPDDVAETDLEAQMSARGLHWSKQDRFWIASEQMYQTIYNFSYTEKRRN
jgi:hypothetical protein